MEVRSRLVNPEVQRGLEIFGAVHELLEHLLT